MNKYRLATISLLAVSLAVANTAMANPVKTGTNLSVSDSLQIKAEVKKSNVKKTKEKKSEGKKSGEKKTGEKKTGLENALDHVKNPTARAAIQRAIDRKKAEQEVKTDEQAVAADQAALAIGFNGSDTITSVTQALNLPAKGKYGSVITWISANTAVVSNDGKTVTRPAQSDVKVVLTATLTKNAVTVSKTIEVIVKAKLNDQQSVATDKAALAIGFTASNKADFVTSPLTLPATGTNGSQITWVSSAPAIISNDGKTVNRPAIGQGDASVTLIATLSSNGVTDIKTFNLIVKQQLSDADKVAADKAALTIGYAVNDSATSVTTKLVLPAAGVNGSTILWVSGTPGVISNDGQTIVRPAAGAGDMAVTLTATITSNGVVDVKSFILVVKQQLTDAQKVAADKAALAIGFSGTDTAGSVTWNMMFPLAGVNGSIIVWYSSNTAVASDNGTVVRPAAGTGDKSITLTAVLVNNASVDTKSFTVTVKQLP